MKFTNSGKKLHIIFSELKENDLFVQVSDGWIFQKRNNNTTCNAFDFGNNCMVTFSDNTHVQRIKIEEIIFSEIK